MRQLLDKRIVLATHNAGKLVEIGALLSPFALEVVSAGQLGFPEPIETEDTFAGNARIKAHFAAVKSGLPALSDDSGIIVDGLDGAPGVHTADWAETPNGRDFLLAMRRVQTLLDKKDVARPRTARFICCLCLAWPDGDDRIFEGSVEGRLVWPLRGENGFGFDPMFLPAGETLTFGEMDGRKKHGISHRAKAFEKLVAALANV